jgi:hypothetical protein
MSNMSWYVPPDRKFGASLRDPVPTADKVATATIQPAPRPSLAGLASPSDPMFWFGVLAAGTFALMAYSTATLA